MYVCMYACMCVYYYVGKMVNDPRLREPVYVCMYVCMHVCIYTIIWESMMKFVRV